MRICPERNYGRFYYFQREKTDRRLGFRFQFGLPILFIRFDKSFERRCVSVCRFGLFTISISVRQYRFGFSLRFCLRSVLRIAYNHLATLKSSPPTVVRTSHVCYLHVCSLEMSTKLIIRRGSLNIISSDETCPNEYLRAYEYVHLMSSGPAEIFTAIDWRPRVLSHTHTSLLLCFVFLFCFVLRRFLATYR